MKITNIAMDERAQEQMDPAVELLERVVPEFGIAFADNHKSYKRYQKSTDISVAVGDPFDQNDLIERRKKGISLHFMFAVQMSFRINLHFLIRQNRPIWDGTHSLQDLMARYVGPLIPG
ncbi:hypothetical protein KUH03_03655 [Sphingobacterium sp. E70]|nr:glycoside hydrolase domain-containing protein [Sphingobacterium sp. E70]ULT26070.1 hypothetical protein KUH03_03655 [Sphingobacterium sp. E70]